MRAKILIWTFVLFILISPTLAFTPYDCASVGSVYDDFDDSSINATLWTGYDTNRVKEYGGSLKMNGTGVSNSEGKAQMKFALGRGGCVKINISNIDKRGSPSLDTWFEPFITQESTSIQIFNDSATLTLTDAEAIIEAWRTETNYYYRTTLTGNTTATLYNFSINQTSQPKIIIDIYGGDQFNLSVDKVWVNDTGAGILNISIFDESRNTLITWQNITITRNDDNFIEIINTDKPKVFYNVFPETKLYIIGTNYSARRYTSITPTWPMAFQTLYLLNTSLPTSQNIIFTVLSDTYLEDVNFIISRILTNGSLVKIFEGKTDVSGKVSLYLDNLQYYYFNLTKQGYSDNNFGLYPTDPPYTFYMSTLINTTYPENPLENINYSFNNNASQINFSYNTINGSEVVINMSVVRTTAYFNETICTAGVNSTNGSLVCALPAPASTMIAGNWKTNTTYWVLIYKNGNFMGYGMVNNPPTSNTTQAGLILTVFAFLTLAGMFMSSKVGMVVFGLAGLGMMILLNIFAGGGIIGIGSSFVWLAVAAAILIWKLRSRKVN